MKRPRLVAYTAGLATGAVAALIGWMISEAREPKRHLIVQYNSPGTIIWDGPDAYRPYADEPKGQASVAEFLAGIASKCGVKQYKIVDYSAGSATENQWVRQDLSVLSNLLSGQQRSCLNSSQKLPYIQTYFEIDQAHAQTH